MRGFAQGPCQPLNTLTVVPAGWVLLLLLMLLYAGVADVAAASK